MPNDTYMYATLNLAIFGSGKGLLPDQAITKPQPEQMLTYRQLDP